MSTSPTTWWCWTCACWTWCRSPGDCGRAAGSCSTPELPRDLGPFEGFRLAHVDAAAIALRHGLGARTQPIINTAMMGAFARMLGAPPLDAVAEAIREAVPRLPDENAAAAREAYAAVVLAGAAPVLGLGLGLEVGR